MYTLIYCTCTCTYSSIYYFISCRHFESLLSQYGPCLCVDLLGNRDMEPLLTEAYVDHLRNLEEEVPGAAEYVQFDYHAHCRPKHKEALETVLLPMCSRFIETCSYYLETDGQVLGAQTGVLRVNCLDCLDRSNNSQAMFGQQVMVDGVIVMHEHALYVVLLYVVLLYVVLWLFVLFQLLVQQLDGLKLSSKVNVLSRFKQIFERLWMQNGDNISKLYAGTRALGSSSKVIADDC